MTERPLPDVHRLLRAVRRRLFPAREPDLTAHIERALGGIHPVFFVQVGSNDGVSGDPLHRLIIEHEDWMGILVEPVRPLFERLKTNYGHSSRLIFENVAIGQREEPRRFYYVSERAAAELGDDLPFWYDQLGSFDRDHIIKHLDGILEPYIAEETIHCTPLQALLDKHDVSRIDLLHVDVEGFDYQVLAQLDFQTYHPKVVLYEHLHLSAGEQEQARALLTAEGYNLSIHGADTLGVSYR